MEYWHHWANERLGNQGNEEPLVVKTRMEDPRCAMLSKSVECDTSMLLTLLLG